MNVTFASILDHMETYYEEDESNEPLLDSGVESESMDIVRSGMNLSDGFWDNFISLCGDSQAISELFEVPRSKVATWGKKINSLIEKIEKEDSNDSERADTITTSDEELADPEGTNAQGEQPADLRPTP
jgi:hypothetical protein